jgi:H+-transporting ATPase
MQHLTVFVARTRGPFWSIRPSPILLAAVVGTQLLATLIAVYGIFMAPIGWYWAAIIWGYVLVMFLVQDRVKIAALRIFARYPECISLWKRRIKRAVPVP